MFDNHTNEAIAEISSSYESKTPIDDKLIDKYVLTLDRATTQQPSYFQTIIPLINQVLLDKEYGTIDPTGILIKLLEKVLSYINFEEVLELYPPQFIIQNLFTSSTISILCLKILRMNIHQPQTQEFLSSNDVMPQLIQLFFEETTPISVLNLIESLVSVLNSDEVHLLGGTESLYSVRKSNNPILLARLLDLLLVLIDKLNLEAKLYNFELEEIVTFSDDPLFLILLIQFYVNSIGMNLNIEGSIANVLTLYNRGSFDDIVKSEVADLIAKMSYNNYATLLSSFEVFKSYNFIKIYEKDEVEIRILSKSNPDVVHKLNPSIYDDVLKNLPLFDHAYFPILINVIASPSLWNSLQPKITNEKLESLSKDRLFQLLLSMSKYNHTKEYLFNNLPTVVSDEIIESDIRNNDIWRLKLEVLENLKHSEGVSGYQYWQPKIEKAYNLMKFGQNYKHVQPKVEVVDDTV